MSLYHRGLVKIIVKIELYKQGIEWGKFLMDNGFKEKDTTWVVIGNFLLDTTEIRSKIVADKTMDPTFEDTKDVKEVLGISWFKKDIRGKGSLKENIAAKWIPQTRTTKSMVKRLQEEK